MSDSLGRGRDLGICVSLSAANALDANTEPSLTSAFGAGHTVRPPAALSLSRAERMEKEDPGVQPRLPPKGAKKDAHTLAVHLA